MSEEQKTIAKTSPLDRALEGLECSIREREQAEQPIYITLNKTAGSSINDLHEEKEAVYRILRTWKAHAAFAGKKEAVAECERVIAFLDALCK